MGRPGAGLDHDRPGARDPAPVRGQRAGRRGAAARRRDRRSLAGRRAARRSAAGSPCRSRWRCSNTTSSRSSSRWTSRPARSTSRSRPSSCASATAGPSRRRRPRGWPSAAVERIDAQRTVRRETIDDARRRDAAVARVTLLEPDIDARPRGGDERSSRAGIDLIRVEVPIGRELADRLTDAGSRCPAWQPRDTRDGPRRARAATEPAPTGSQRALPGSAARPTGPPRGDAPTSGWRPSRRPSGRRRAPSSPRSSGSTSSSRTRWPRSSSAASTRIGRSPTTPSPTGSPGGPARPSWSGPVRSSSPRTCRPASRPTRRPAPAGPCAAAARGGAGPRRRPVRRPDHRRGAAAWLTDEPAPGARAIAEVVVRRALFPGHPLGFVEPPTRGGSVAAVAVRPGRGGAPHAGDIALVLRAADFGRTTRSPRRGRPAPPRSSRPTSPRDRARAAPRDRPRPRPRDGRGRAETLDRLADHGWRTVTGDPAGSRSARARREVVAERTETFDPFAMLLGPARADDRQAGVRLEAGQPPRPRAARGRPRPRPTGLARSPGSPSTNTLMCGRSRGPASTSRSRRPGHGRVERADHLADRPARRPHAASRCRGTARSASAGSMTVAIDQPRGRRPRPPRSRAGCR